MRVEKACTRTVCDERSGRDDCSRCLDACLDAYTCDPSTACRLNCGSSSAPTCSDADRAQCVKTEWTAQGIAAQPGPEVLAACGRMFDKLDSCHLQISGRSRSDCSTWAKVERPANAATYDCVANAPCDGDLSGCVLPPSTLGDDVCGAFATMCGTEMLRFHGLCSAEERAFLNEVGGAFKDDVVAAEKGCLAYTKCDDSMECHHAWRKAVGY